MNMNKKYSIALIALISTSLIESNPNHNKKPSTTNQPELQDLSNKIITPEDTYTPTATEQETQESDSLQPSVSGNTKVTTTDAWTFYDYAKAAAAIAVALALGTTAWYNKDALAQQLTHGRNSFKSWLTGTPSLQETLENELNELQAFQQNSKPSNQGTKTLLDTNNNQHSGEETESFKDDHYWRNLAHTINLHPEYYELLSRPDKTGLSVYRQGMLQRNLENIHDHIQRSRIMNGEINRHPSLSYDEIDQYREKMIKAWNEKFDINDAATPFQMIPRDSNPILHEIQDDWIHDYLRDPNNFEGKQLSVPDKDAITATDAMITIANRQRTYDKFFASLGGLFAGTVSMGLASHRILNAGMVPLLAATPAAFLYSNANPRTAQESMDATDKHMENLQLHQ